METFITKTPFNTHGMFKPVPKTHAFDVLKEGDFLVGNNTGKFSMFDERVSIDVRIHLQPDTPSGVKYRLDLHRINKITQHTVFTEYRDEHDITQELKLTHSDHIDLDDNGLNIIQVGCFQNKTKELLFSSYLTLEDYNKMMEDMPEFFFDDAFEADKFDEAERLLEGLKSMTIDELLVKLRKMELV